MYIVINASEITESIKGLPPFPDVVGRALKMLDDPNASVPELVSVVEYDPSITANVLKLCNSAYYGLSREVHSLREGIVLLGNAQLKDIILAGTAVKYLGKGTKGYDLAKGELWKHSVATGIFGRIIANHVLKEEVPSVFTACLLHDIGKVVLDTFVDEYFNHLMEVIYEEKRSFMEAERAVFGTDHAEVGAQVTRKWEFPEEIVQAIENHHRPEAASDDDMITPVVYLANIFTVLAGIGIGRSGLFCRGKESVMSRFGLDAKDVQDFLLEFYDEFNKVQDLLGLV